MNYMYRIYAVEKIKEVKRIIILSYQCEAGMCYVFKELSFYQILKFSNPYTFATQCNGDLIFQTMKSNN